MEANTATDRKERPTMNEKKHAERVALGRAMRESLAASTVKPAPAATFLVILASTRDGAPSHASVRAADIGDAAAIAVSSLCPARTGYASSEERRLVAVVDLGVYDEVIEHLPDAYRSFVDGSITA